MEIHISRYTGKIAECLAGLSDSESVSGAWEEIINAADAVLGRMERVNYKKWFDEEREQVKNQKNQTYKIMQQTNHTRGAVEEYHEARRGEKGHIKRKKDYDKQELIELESLRSSYEIRAHY
jgi:hypothetical protein